MQLFFVETIHHTHQLFSVYFLPLFDIQNNVDIDEYYKEMANNLENDSFFTGSEIQLILQKAIATLPQKQQLVLKF